MSDHVLILVITDPSQSSVILHKQPLRSGKPPLETGGTTPLEESVFFPYIYTHNSSLSLPTKNECQIIKQELGIDVTWKCCLAMYLKVHCFTGSLQMIKCIQAQPSEVNPEVMKKNCLEWFPVSSVADLCTENGLFSHGKELFDISQMLLKQQQPTIFTEAAESSLPPPPPSIVMVNYITETTASTPPDRWTFLPGGTTAAAAQSDFTGGAAAAGTRRLFSDFTHDLFTERDRQDVYDHYLQACLPSHTMGAPQFIRCMQSMAFSSSSNGLRYFRLWDTKRYGYLTYSQYLLAIACIDPIVPHCGKMAELRCRIIFRFYDADKDEALNREEFKQLLNDIKKAKKSHTHREDSATNLLSLEFGAENKITEKSFLRAVGSLKLRGTSQLLRAKSSLIQRLRDKRSLQDSAAAIGQGSNNHSSENSIISNLPGDSWDDIVDRNAAPLLHQQVHPSSHNDDSLQQHHPPPSKRYRCHHPQLHYRYEVALHTVRVRRGGEVTNVSTIWDMPSTAISQSAESNLLAGKTRMDRLLSIDCFNQKSHANEMVNGLRFFERSIARPEFKKSCYSWGPVDRRGLATCLLALCDVVLPLLMQEKRLLRLSSPCYILGDIHGNYPCLMSFEKALWRLGPNLMPAQFLFLGDYVDRGAHGVETIAYLFAQKVQCPHKIHLLRGNHEIGSIQENFSFKQECLNKFGSHVGLQVWEKVNNCFDCMPLAATIDQQVFCVHGGIPRPSLLPTLEEINHQIPCPLSHVTEALCPLAWELMWSDPFRNENEAGSTPPTVAAAPTLAANHHPNPSESGDVDGEFLPNKRRGTAFFFSAKALGEFLRKHDLSHVIRAHESKQDGFQVQQNARLLTVFSSSDYCNCNNEAACILADQGKLRVIRLDTS